MDLALILKVSGILDEGAVLQARRMSEVMRLPFCHVALRYGYIDSKSLVVMLGRALDLVPVDIDRVEVQKDLVAQIPEDLSLALRVLPLHRAQEGSETLIDLAMTDPTDTQALRQIGKRLGLRARPLLAEDTALERAIRRHHAAARVPLDDESAEIDVLPSVVGKLLVATPSDLDGVPDPFDPVSADNTDDIPSIPLRSFEARAVPTITDESPQEFGRSLIPSGSVSPRTDPLVHALPQPLMMPPDTNPEGGPMRSGESKIHFVNRKVLFVSEDVNVRKRLERDMKGVLDPFTTEVSLAHVLQVGAPVDDVVLYKPKGDVRTKELLVKLCAQWPRARIILISPMPGLDNAAGVAFRVPVPDDEMGISAVVLDALARTK